LPRTKYLIGIDEVGRGPLAGPVAVGAFVFLTPDSRLLFRGVKESKQLTEEEREEWYKKILIARDSGHIDFKVTFKSEKVIDNKGLSFAIRKSVEISLNKLDIDPDSALVLLDGGLKAPSIFENQKTIIRGDEKEMVIALASICAKVKRDRKMRRMAKKYLNYGFEVHKGYGTKAHYEAIERLGPCLIHRQSFLHKL